MVIVVGPSGVGKKMDRRWIEHEQPTVFKHVPSFTTRQPRPQESKGIDYIQVPKEQYDAMLNKGDLIENACFGLNCQAFSLAETKKYINLGYLPITDVNMDGAIQIRDNMAKLPEEERVPLLFFSIMTHWPKELKYNIYNRDFMTDEDKAARWAANQIEIKKIQKNIDEGFFSQVF